MYPYKSLSKSQLIELLNSIESTLRPAIKASSLAGKEYSAEPISQLAFEIGHLSGYVNQAIDLIEATKNC